MSILIRYCTPPGGALTGGVKTTKQRTINSTLSIDNIFKPHFIVLFVRVVSGCRNVLHAGCCCSKLNTLTTQRCLDTVLVPGLSTNKLCYEKTIKLQDVMLGQVL